MTKDVPTSSQIELAKAIAYQTGKRLPRGYSVRSSTCAGFIEENKAYIRPTDAQISFALGLAKIYRFKMERTDFLSYEFCKAFLNLFAGTKNDVCQGYRRMKIIESYLQEDKEFEHLQFKLDLSADEVAFMKEFIVSFRHDGFLTRWDDQASQDESFPELAENSNAVHFDKPQEAEEITTELEKLHSLASEKKEELLVLKEI